MQHPRYSAPGTGCKAKKPESPISGLSLIHIYLETQDSISRSVGLLRSAKLLSNDEFMKLISNVRLGISTGLIEHLSLETINALMVRVQPATIQLPEGKALPAAQRDSLRANLVREALTE